jgi:hypothetical protein
VRVLRHGAGEWPARRGLARRAHNVLLPMACLGHWRGACERWHAHATLLTCADAALLRCAVAILSFCALLGSYDRDLPCAQWHLYAARMHVYWVAL